MKENERRWKNMKENVRFSFRNIGVPPRREFQNVHFPVAKKESAETKKMEPLKNVNFS